MGLAETVQKMAQVAFKVIDNIPLTCTFTSTGTPVYNPATGTYSGGDTAYSGKSILFEDYKAMEIIESAGTIVGTDQKASLPVLNLTPTPKITDKITDPGGKIWTVKNVNLDPARALYVFQVRTS